MADQESTTDTIAALESVLVQLDEIRAFVVDTIRDMGAEPLTPIPSTPPRAERQEDKARKMDERRRQREEEKLAMERAMSDAEM